ncbi:hypothetical protein F4806DRAFT_502786 [Annulohypoxylon nitens]|nr:hypothetical protein F4806DRAFT_502786 [Annulohypoxylon nitens]
MANISDLTAAVVSAKNEVTLALANSNFDFSLIKVEAPREFQQLGNALSPRRRKTAEEGSVHRTARKLGALFEQISTPGPELVKAYGQRASQISSFDTSQHTERRWNNIFQEHAGTDGTAIWAAADQISLLYDGTQPSHIAHLAAARQEIERKELAEWDASARAWLEIADKVKDMEHRKMEDIVMRLSLPVDSSSDVFESVTRAWTTAMTTMENLCKGMPQRVHNGAALIAITAWHLYPDMSLYGPQFRSLQQRDSLVAPGGQLTVGLEDANPSSALGVYWSLSLANLRFYGDPVLSTSNANNASRVTFQDLLLVYMGGLFAGWDSEDFDAIEDNEKGAEFILALWKSLNLVALGYSGFPKDDQELALDIVSSPKNTWFHLLVSAAKDLLSRNDHERQTARRLIALGTRQGSRLLRPRNESSPAFFGLLDASTWLRFMSPDVRVEMLRNLADKLKLDHKFSKVLIRYRRPQPLDGSESVEFATIFPLEGNPDIWGKSTQVHVRWILRHAQMHFAPCRFPESCTNRLETLLGLTSVTCPREYFCCNTYISLFQSLGEEVRLLTKYELGHNIPTRHDMNVDMTTLESGIDIEETLDPNQGTSERWFHLLGDTETATIIIYPNNDEEPYEEGALNSFLSINLRLGDVLSFLETKPLNVVELLRAISVSNVKDDMDVTPNSFSTSMQVLATAAELYSNLPNTTVSLRVLEQHLWTSPWFPHETQQTSQLLSLLIPVELNLPQAFSCISMFETGSLQITPQELTGVLAMCSGNSIIAAASLLADPFDAQTEKGLRSIIGNVGRPGVSMLIPPTNLNLAKTELDAWKVISHDRFSGKCSDSFGQTSVHLSFTGYEQSIASTVLHGARDLVACYLETAVSVFDGRKWIGDMDILHTLYGKDITRVSRAPECNHTATDCHPIDSWVSINSWEELLELPSKRNVIITAHGNPLSRLATAAVCLQKYGRSVRCLLLPPDICCYRCAIGDSTAINQDERRLVFIC